MEGFHWCWFSRKVPTLSGPSPTSTLLGKYSSGSNGPVRTSEKRFARLTPSRLLSPFDPAIFLPQPPLTTTIKLASPHCSGAMSLVNVSVVKGLATVYCYGCGSMLRLLPAWFDYSRKR
uniref:Uncharacterized protein n=1 Tax=Vespula pensylvanica TaxID=30213 RepID=A0A834NQS6_VESPE|nr:hypothetical protein H0235_012426 [Vespula pensylvanica]